MIYTINTRAIRHGFVFKPHELEPVGMGEDAKCWGLWSEGRNLDEQARLDGTLPDGTPRWMRNESPHLIVSPLHPDWWPISFNLQVLLERRKLQAGNLENSDAFAGFTDALARCGANIVYIQMAQIGYDLLSVVATCDFPDLRPLVRDILIPVDSAGVAVEAARLALQRAEANLSNAQLPVEPNEQSPARLRQYENAKQDVAGASSQLVKAESSAFRERVRGFQHIGRIMLPKLALVEAQLALIDRHRYCHSEEVSQDSAPDEVAASLERSTGEQGWEDPFRFRILVGHSPDIGGPNARRDVYRSSLNRAWFLNRKVVGAGENLYFLGYTAIARDRSLLLPADPNLRRSFQSLDEPSDEELAKIFGHYFGMLKNRRIPQPLDEFVDPVTPRSNSRALSGTAERLTHDNVNPLNMVPYAHRTHLLTQALLPVRVASLPSLAYARFWALGGAQGRGKAIEFKYADGILRPIQGGTNPTGRLAPIFDLMNSITRCPSPDEPELGGFGPQCAVIVNVNLHERMLRLRFVREAVEAKAYQQLVFDFALKHSEPGTRGPRPPGLLASICSTLLTLGLRVERAKTTLTYADGTRESGLLELQIRAIDDRGLDWCLRSDSPSERAKQAHLLPEKVRQLSANPVNWEKLECSIMPGFVPFNR